MLRLPLLFLLSLILALPSPAAGQAAPSTTPSPTALRPWRERLGELAVQDGGRVMPLDTFARNLAVQLTGRTHWSAGSGPEAFSGRDHMQLFFDLLCKGQASLHKPLIIIESAPFKTKVGLDPKQRFFAPVEIGGCKGVEALLIEHNQAIQANPQAQATRDQKQALELQAVLEKLGVIMNGEPLPIVPGPAGRPFLKAGLLVAEPGAEQVVAALTAFAKAYSADAGLDAAAEDLARAIQTGHPLDADAARAVSLELKYNAFQPWTLAAVFYGLALILLGASRLVMPKFFLAAGAVATVAGVVTHAIGIGMRIAILGRAPVSNTYEALLWMGLVGIGVAGVAQLINRRAWYLVSGIAVAELSVLFSNLVPLESQTGALPAVLRSNYWLIIHVLTITASYGVLAVASLLSHVYLVKEVLLSRTGAVESRLAHPLIAQTYRCMQLGLLLLTAGTILGGVWAADSWGRFWGWDPKETWALISIVVYFIILHARHLRWLRDFGMAACTALAFASIVWTFYGVNYLMASGLHSYGFGSGGGGWVACWAVAEVLFVGACWLRYRSLAPASVAPLVAADPSPAQPARMTVQGA